jgi:hypothetical protein
VVPARTSRSSLTATSHTVDFQSVCTSEMMRCPTEDCDELVTLEEALAFIDSIDLDDVVDDTSLASSCIDSDNSLFPASASDVAAIQHHASKTKKRKRSNLSSSTRLQQRKKAEVLFLRRRAQELQEYLDQLKSRRARFSSPGETNALSDGCLASSWARTAKTFQQARLRSEDLNRRLKALMATQLRVNHFLRESLQLQVSLQVRFPVRIL